MVFSYINTGKLEEMTWENRIDFNDTIERLLKQRTNLNIRISAETTR